MIDSTLGKETRVQSSHLDSESGKMEENNKYELYKISHKINRKKIRLFLWLILNAIEFKETVTNTFLKTVSAFSNYNGGLKYFL